MNNFEGYAHPDYIFSLSEFGEPLNLPRSGSWLLKRQIPGSPYWDAMGPYPLFFCHRWSQLQRDLEELGDDLVSISLVTDPFGEYIPMDLHRCFQDVVIPFKEHFIADLRRPLNEIVGKSNRQKARRALKKLKVNICLNPMELLEEWTDLYGHLIRRHNITGIRAFSKKAFAKQLSIPGSVALHASYDNVMVGAALYFRQDDVVHCHLGAANEIGYELGAFYAIDFSSIAYFSNKVRYLNLGGGAGLVNDNDGVSLYKRGWSTETRITYFCGRINSPARYAEIIKNRGIAPNGYFPAYRKGEFG